MWAVGECGGVLANAGGSDIIGVLVRVLAQMNEKEVL